MEETQDTQEMMKMINLVQDKKFSEFSTGIKDALNTIRDNNSSYKVYSQEKEVYNTVIDNSKSIMNMGAHKTDSTDSSGSEE